MLLTEPTLVVGDIHATAEELDDCSNLIEYVIELCKKYGYTTVIFLGDQFHTHSVLSLPVVAFWRTAVQAINQRTGARQIYLRGNHDMAANGEGSNALDVFRDLLDPDKDLVVDDMVVTEDVCFLAHQVDHAKFAERVTSPAASMCPVLVCHQTFVGAEYENGFYAADGIDQNVAPQKRIISGHIHKAAILGKLEYPGSPRWRSKSDANMVKSIVGYPNGLRGTTLAHFTEEHCTPIEISEDTPAAPARRRWWNSKFTVIVKGPADHVKARSAEFEAQGIGVQRRPDVRTSARVSESQAIGASMIEFMKAYRGVGGTSGERLAAMAAQRFA